MDKKKAIREKFYLIRKKKYFEIDKYFFFPLIKLLKKINFKSENNLGIYYPCSNEVNVLAISNLEYFKNFSLLLPVINNNNSIHFFSWKKKDILKINKFGIPEPLNKKKFTPNVLLVPLLAYDKKKNRLGYGKGYYDKYLGKLKKFGKKMITIGVAFSFQKHDNLPVNINDVKLDYILTEKGIF